MSNELIEGISVISTEIINNSAKAAVMTQFIFVVYLIFTIAFLSVAINAIFDLISGKKRPFCCGIILLLFLIFAFKYIVPALKNLEKSATDTVHIIRVEENISTEALQELYQEYEIIEQNEVIWKIKEK